MPRTARVVIPGVPHHVIQRGNRRQKTFFQLFDYHSYLSIAAEEFAAAGVEVWAYCLMPNHVHLVATPATADGLAEAVGATHLRYTRRINRREGWTGFLWQGRFASFPMDEPHLMRCVRYVGLNPVRSGLVARALDWRWSSVRAHLQGAADPLLTPAPVAQRLGAEQAGFFDVDVDDEVRRAFRKAGAAGQPLGAAAWVRELEAATGRRLLPRPVGRPRRN
jgi:putative transposase